MDDLIERDKLLDNLPKNDTMLSLDVRRIVVEASAVDAAPVAHGRWIASHDEFYACSICKYPFYVGWNQANYCPNCGAKMNGEEDAE